MAGQRQDDQLEHTYSSYVKIRDVALKTYQRRWTIGRSGERGSGISVLAARHDDDDSFTDADYADDIAFLAFLTNTPAQAETLLHRLERAATGIGLHVNAHKTEYMCFNQTCEISTLNSSSLKLVDKFTYLGNSASSTETDINMRLGKAWTTIDRLLVIWKSDLTDKIKRSLFQAVVVSILLYGCTTWTLLNVLRKSLTVTTQMLLAILNKS